MLPLFLSLVGRGVSECRIFGYKEKSHNSSPYNPVIWLRKPAGDGDGVHFGAGRSRRSLAFQGEKARSI
jgi:hypothetical protein